MDKIRLVIVDDHPMVLEGMKAMLSQINYIDMIGTAANAFEAMELLRGYDVDVAIVDINLPEISGIELTEK